MRLRSLNDRGWLEFPASEMRTSYWDTGRYFRAAGARLAIEKGVSGPRHMSVGQFRPHKTYYYLNDDTECIIPYTYLEVEEGDIVDRFWATREILQSLATDGVSVGRLQVMFSGNKSWHIMLPSFMLGNPVGSAYDQFTLRQRLFQNRFEFDLDCDLWRARHLIRMVGSEHERGGRVRIFGYYSFMNTTLDALLTQRMINPIKLIHPFVGEPDQALTEMIDLVSGFYVPPYGSVDPNVSSGDNMIKSISNGIGRGEAWADKHVGRNKAAFVFSCMLVRQGQGASGDVPKALLTWNEQNRPPLDIKTLRQCHRSALRTVLRSR